MEDVNIISKGIWKHFKGGRYQVLGVGIVQETGDLMVMYKTLYQYKDYDRDQVFLKLVKDWLSPKELDGKRIQRYEFVE